MGGVVQGWLVPDRGVVVGEAPEHRARAAGLAESVQHGAGVVSGRVLADEHRVRVLAARGREAELREPHVLAAAEPAGDARQERHQKLVGGAARPPRVDGIAVHRQEVTCLRRFART